VWQGAVSGDQASASASLIRSSSSGKVAARRSGAGAGEEGNAAAEHDRVEVEALFVDQARR
jgi:hypothetical protein